jgi:hypothetical protein
MKKEGDRTTMHGQVVEVEWRFLGDEPDGEAVSVIRWK